MNVHIEKGLEVPVLFPDSETQLTDQYGQQYFRMSSC